jgi:threonine dehydrogenase-like Zn-dependent dehydrogenase
MFSVRRGGTFSVIGVYVGALPAFPLGELFDRQITIRMGQANVRRWTKEIVAAAESPDDPLSLRDFVTHVLPLDDAPRAYRMFQQKEDGAVKVVFKP